MYSLSVTAGELVDGTMLSMHLSHPKPDLVLEALRDPRWTKIMFNAHDDPPHVFELGTLNRLDVKVCLKTSWLDFRGPLVDNATARRVLSSKLPRPAQLMACSAAPDLLRFDIDFNVESLGELNAMLHC